MRNKLDGIYEDEVKNIEDIISQCNEDTIVDSNISNDIDGIRNEYECYKHYKLNNGLNVYYCGSNGTKSVDISDAVYITKDIIPDLDEMMCSGTAYLKGSIFRELMAKSGMCRIYVDNIYHIPDYNSKDGIENIARGIFFESGNDGEPDYVKFGLYKEPESVEIDGKLKYYFKTPTIVTNTTCNESLVESSKDVNDFSDAVQMAMRSKTPVVSDSEIADANELASIKSKTKLQHI
ncbi:MAG TPA: hypothetical protein PLC25_01800 [Bacilli bacterium]|nr:hypothetical protein [Bacilli bacterium]